MKTLIYLGIILTLASCGPNKEEGPNKEQIKEEERMRMEAREELQEERRLQEEERMRAGAREESQEERYSNEEERMRTVAREEPQEEIMLQEKESALTAESQQEASSSDGNGEADEQEAQYDLGNVYGQGGGEEGGDGEGGSDGGTGGGDGLGNGEGVGDGSSRKIKKVPNLDNLTTTPAKVAVKIKINNEGKVYWSEAQLSNPFTNVRDKAIINLAEKKALEFTYKPTSASTKYDVKTLKLEFKVN